MVLAASDAFLASYVLLWAVMAIAVIALLGIARQVGLISSRIPAFEADLPSLSIGEHALPVRGITLDDEEIALGPDFGGRTVLAFVTDGCDFCSALPAKLEEISQAVPDVRFWFVAKTKPAPASGLRHPFALHHMVIAPEAFEKWGVYGTPFGFVLGTNNTILGKGDLIGTGRLYETLDPSPVTSSAAVDTKEALAQ